MKRSAAPAGSPLLRWMPSVMAVIFTVVLVLVDAPTIVKVMGAFVTLIALLVPVVQLIKPAPVTAEIMSGPEAPAAGPDTDDRNDGQTDNAGAPEPVLPSSETSGETAQPDAQPPEADSTENQGPAFPRVTLEQIATTVRTVVRSLWLRLAMVIVLVTVATVAFVVWDMFLLMVGAGILAAITTLSLVRHNADYPSFAVAARPIGPGPRRVLWWFWTRLNLYRWNWIPQPRTHGLYARRVAEDLRYIHDNRWESSTIGVVMTLKGGATKTTVLTWLAAFIKQATQWMLFVMDLDHGRGKVELRFGEPRPGSGVAWTVKEALRRISDNPYTLTDREVREHAWADPETGVMFFHGPIETHPFDEHDVIVTLQRLNDLYHTALVDLRGTLSDPSLEGAFWASYVRMIPCHLSSDEEVRDVAATLLRPGYALSEFDPAVVHEDPASILYGLPVITSVNPSVMIVLSDVPRARYNERTRHEMAELFGINPERIVLIPRNPVMVKTRQVRLGSVSPRVLHAVSQAARVFTTIAIQENRYAKTAGSMPASGLTIQSINEAGLQTGSYVI